MRHRCGGELQPQLVKIQKKIGYYKQTFTVVGYKCDNCDEVVISGDMAHEIDRTIVRLRELWRNWNIPFSTSSTYLK